MRAAEVIAPSEKKELRLSNKDREIINILTINSRTPLSQIAKFLKTSTEVVSYHYDNLRKQRVITDVFATPDPKLLGVHRYVLYMQFHSLSQDKMKTIISDFLKNESINWVIESGGKWELIIMFEALDENRYDALLEEIILPIRDYLNDYSIAIVKDFIHKSSRYIRDMKKKEYYENKISFPYEKEFNTKKKEDFTPDDKDILLLKYLHEDSRITLIDLGKKLKLSGDAVDYRIKKLIRAGIIKSFLLRLNYHLLDFQYNTIMLKFKSISQKRKNEFLNFVYEDERFYALMDQIGLWDVSLFMFFKNAKDLRDFIISIKEKFSDVIHSHESVIQFNQYYYSYLSESVVKELIAKTKRS